MAKAHKSLFNERI